MPHHGTSDVVPCLFTFLEHGASERGISDLHAVLTCAGVIVCTNYRINKLICIFRHVLKPMMNRSRKIKLGLTVDAAGKGTFTILRKDELISKSTLRRVATRALLQLSLLASAAVRARARASAFHALAHACVDKNLPELHETSTTAPTAMVCCWSPPKCCCSAAYL